MRRKQKFRFGLREPFFLTTFSTHHARDEGLYTPLRSPISQVKCIGDHQTINRDLRVASLVLSLGSEKKTILPKDYPFVSVSNLASRNAW